MDVPVVLAVVLGATRLLAVLAPYWLTWRMTKSTHRTTHRATHRARLVHRYPGGSLLVIVRGSVDA